MSLKSGFLQKEHIKLVDVLVMLVELETTSLHPEKRIAISYVGKQVVKDF